MKFSLQALIALVLLSALSVNAWQLWQRLNRERREIQNAQNDARWQYQQLGGAAQDVSVRVEKVAVVEDLESIRENAIAKFDSYIDATYQLKIKPNQFSIIERPQFHHQFYRKSYRVFVPENEKLVVLCKLEDAKPMVADAVGVFDSIKAGSFELPQGESLITFGFEKDGGDDAKEDRWEMYLDIDRERVCSRGYGPLESWGFSSSQFTFRQQRDYGNVNPLPQIIKFQPSNGLHNVQIFVKRLSEMSHEAD